MVYGKFFCKPFSKTRVHLPLESWLSLYSLSFSLCSLLFTVPSHWATPNTPSHLAFSLAQLVPSQPRATLLSLSPISLLAPKPPSHRSHSKGPPSIRRTNLSLTDLILIRSWSWSDLIFFFFFSFDIWDLLIFFGKLNDIWELFIIVNTILHSKLNFFYYNLMHFICSFIR